MAKRTSGWLLLPLLLTLVLVISGCPQPPAPDPGTGKSQGGGNTPAQPPQPPPPPPPKGGEPGGGGPPPPPPWRLIPGEALTGIAWPMLDPVATWPAPEGLVAPEKSPVARPVDPAEIKDLAFVVEKVLEKAYRPTDPRAAVGLDEQGRIHMKLGRGKVEGSASLATHPGGRPPTFCFALETGKPAAKTIEELRQQVADVVAEPLAEELAKPRHRLEPHPKGFAGVGLAELDRRGFGERFLWMYAYSSEGKLLVVMHEVPHVILPEKQ